MLTYWETLIARKSNITVSDSYAKLWGKKSQSGYTVETYIGTLPATLQTVEGYLESYKIYGNAVQDGTPTPENPIMPSGCGELETTGAHVGQYKLPILSNTAVTSIYLGEVETTRRIRKIEFTGNETWTQGRYPPDNHCYQFYTEKPSKMIGSEFFMVSHFINKEVANGCRIGDFFSIFPKFSLLPENAKVNDFKAYLAAQYSAGTPVTVWYVLAEPETAVVNEPLMKIGDYADTIDSTQSTVRIPTSAGETTISWAGEGLAPSEVEFVYKVKG